MPFFKGILEGIFQVSEEGTVFVVNACLCFSSSNVFMCGCSVGMLMSTRIRRRDLKDGAKLSQQHLSLNLRVQQTFINRLYIKENQRLRLLLRTNQDYFCWSRRRNNREICERGCRWSLSISSRIFVSIFRVNSNNIVLLVLQETLHTLNYCTQTIVVFRPLRCSCQIISPSCFGHSIQ